MSTVSKASNKKKKINGELLNDELLPQAILNELNDLRVAYGARVKGLTPSLEYLHDLIYLLSDDLRSGSKISLKLHHDSNIRQKKYRTQVKSNYRFLAYKIIPYAAFIMMFAAFAVLLLVELWPLVPVWIFFMIVLSAAMINIRATFFGKPLKYKLVFYQLPIFQLQARLANGIQLQLKADRKLVLIKRIQKKFKFKKNRLTKTSIKHKASLVLAVQVSLPRARYKIAEDEIAYLFRPGILFKGTEITKVKTKSTAKKHTVIIQWPRVEANNGHRRFVFPQLDLNETIELITEGMLSRLNPNKMNKALHQMESEKSDDLTLIHGIGKGIQDLLHEANVYTFQQLAEMPSEALQDFLDSHRLTNTPASDTWQEQAKEFMNK
ncbi:hypothetical protein BKI52_23900 [marine bacterium AO1-C]|nr:hypothetical protein BKI52_23900 [marine bacterium AO1-C]